LEAGTAIRVRDAVAPSSVLLRRSHQASFKAKKNRLLWITSPKGLSNACHVRISGFIGEIASIPGDCFRGLDAPFVSLRFAAWCASKSIDELAAVQPFHVASFVKDLQAEVSPPTVKQHLAAIRMLLDWLVTGHIIDVNSAHAVRGLKHVVKKGKTPVLTADEARTLLSAFRSERRPIKTA
jgi:integrase